MTRRRDVFAVTGNQQSIKWPGYGGEWAKVWVRVAMLLFVVYCIINAFLDSRMSENDRKLNLLVAAVLGLSLLVFLAYHTWTLRLDDEKLVFTRISLVPTQRRVIPVESVSRVMIWRKGRQKLGGIGRIEVEWTGGEPIMLDDSTTVLFEEILGQFRRRLPAAVYDDPWKQEDGTKQLTALDCGTVRPTSGRSVGDWLEIQAAISKSGGKAMILVGISMTALLALLIFTNAQSAMGAGWFVLAVVILFLLGMLLIPLGFVAGTSQTLRVDRRGVFYRQAIHRRSIAWKDMKRAVLVSLTKSGIQDYGLPPRGMLFDSADGKAISLGKEFPKKDLDRVWDFVCVQADLHGFKAMVIENWEDWGLIS